MKLSVLGNDDVRASIPGEIVPHREYYDYAAKYLEERNTSGDSRAADQEAGGRFQEYAVRAFRAIDGAGMARCDFFLERRTGKIFVNELNTIPGFTSISMYPKLWEASGLSYMQLIDRLIDFALELHAKRPARNIPSIFRKAPAGLSTRNLFPSAGVSI